MQKIALTICALFIISGCDRDKDIYPKRPRKSQYYYNETSITEMNQNARIALRRAREKTGIEFVTVILEKIPNTISVEKYAAGLFHKWKIGSKTEGKGVLLLFIEDTHTLKIEVSYELEGIFTDAFCSSFQPTVKSYYAGRYFGDVFCGLVECMVRRILIGEDVEPEATLKGLATDPELLKSSEFFLSGGGGIIDDEYFYEKDAKLSFIRDIPPEKVREFDCDRDIDVVLTRYFKSLEEGINYPFLGMLTEGSQMKRLEYPDSAHFYKSRWEDCREAFPYRIRYKGGLAAVRFKKTQSFPIFLRRTSDSFWKVDEARAWVSSWQDFAANKSGPYHSDHPWMFAFSEYKYRKSLCYVPGLLPVSLTLKEEISRLEKAIKEDSKNASNYFKLADIFYWDCLWISAAIDLVEGGLKLEPDNVPYRWLVIFMRYRFPDPEPNAHHLEKLLSINPDDLEALDYYSRHNWHYTMNYRKAMRILRRARHVEKKLTNSTKKSRWRLDSYKKNYWNQLAVDRNSLWRGWNYFYIFYLPYGGSSKMIIVLLVSLVVVIWTLKHSVKAKTKRFKKAIISAMVLIMISSFGSSAFSADSEKGRTLVVPDEYKTIHTAMKAAESGDTVFVKAGIYEEDEITLKDGVKLVGEARDRVTLRIDIQKGRDVDVILADQPNGLIKNLTVEHIGKTYAKRRQVGIFLVDSSVEVVNCRIRKSVGYGMVVKNSQPVIRNCIFESNGFSGIKVIGKRSFPSILDCNIRSNQQNGVYFDSAGGGLMENNTVEKNEWHGIFVEGAAETVKLRKNHCRANGHNGIYVTKGAKVDVQENTCEDNRKSGILIYKEGAAATLKGNSCIENWENGIWFAEGARGVAENNTCEENSKSGILVSGEKTSAILRNNKCLSNGSNGIYFRWKATGTAEGNICNKNIYNGISAMYKGVITELKNNQCLANGRNGIYFGGGAGGIVESNICSENKWHGISIANIWSVPTLKNNRCSDNARDSVYVEKGEFGPVRWLLVEEEFDELEEIAARLRAEKSRSYTGGWQLSHFYQYLGERWAGHSPSKEEWLLGVLGRWRKEKPESVTPRIVMAKAYIKFGWFARGGGFAKTVTKEGWEVFHAKLRKAREVLKEAEKLSTKDPEVYCLLLRVEQNEGNSGVKMNRLFEKGIAIERGYTPLYHVRAHSLLPRWGGSKKELEAFARRAVKLTREQEGESLYAVIAASVLWPVGPEDYPKLKFSYPRIKQGCIDILERYPESDYYLNAYCFLASIYEDKETARELFDKIGNDWNWDAWNYQKYFNKYKNWAYEKNQEHLRPKAKFPVVTTVVVGTIIVSVLIVLSTIQIARKKAAIKQS